MLKIIMNLKIINKFILLIGIMISTNLFLLVGSVYILNKVKVGGEFYGEIKINDDLLFEMALLKSNINEVRAVFLSTLSQTEKDEIESHQEKIKEISSSIDDKFSLLLENIPEDEIKLWMEAAQATWADFKEVRDNELIPAFLFGDKVKVRQFAGGIQKQRYEKLSEELGNASGSIVLKVDELEIKTEKKIQRSIYLLFILSVLLFLLIIGFLLFITNIITKPLELLTSATVEIAQGNLQVNLNVGERRDEIGRLGRSFQNMADNMQKMNAQLLQSEKMSALGQLAAGVAHEINNPLTVILGFAQSCLKKAVSKGYEEMPLRSIEREANRCKLLVQDLLIFSRNSRSEKSPVEINKETRAVLELILAECKMNSVELVENLAEDLPLVLANPNKIQQIIMNLCKNAIDAMPKGGTLKVVSENFTEGDRSWVCLKVSDTGTGIPKEVQSKIFEPFFTTKPVGKGTGLGMSIVHEIVKDHNGEIEFESRAGFTEFRVKIPVQRKA